MIPRKKVNKFSILAATKTLAIFNSQIATRLEMYKKLKKKTLKK